MATVPLSETELFVLEHLWNTNEPQTFAQLMNYFTTIEKKRLEKTDTEYFPASSDTKRISDTFFYRHTPPVCAFHHKGRVSANLCQRNCQNIL